MALTKLRKPCCSYGIEAKADEHPQRGNIDKYWSVCAKNSVSVNSNISQAAEKLQ